MIELLAPLIVGGLVLFFSMVKILPEWERGVVLRLGRAMQQVKGPGLILLIPGVDRIIRVSVRTLVHDVPPQDVITRDNVSIKVNAVVYFRVLEPLKAINEVEDYLYAVSQLAQTTLRSVAGQAEMDEILVEREKMNLQLQEILDSQTDPWGIKVSAVEIKHIDLPAEMQRAMARQAEAERLRRAKVIAAEGELQAATMLTDAAQVMDAYPAALQLRYLQTLADIATENNSTTLFPIPIDFLHAFKNHLDGGSNAAAPAQRQAPPTPVIRTTPRAPGAETTNEP